MRFGLAATAALVMAASLPTQGNYSCSVIDARDARREAVRPPPRTPGRPVNADELVAMRRKNARKRRR